MKLIILKSTLLIAGTFVFSACNNLTSSDENTATEPDATSAMTIEPFATDSPGFPDARLSVKSLKSVLNDTKDSAIITIEYNVENYELKSQTPDAGTKGCDNSKDGQHIHFILNNTPYIALYEPGRTFSVPVNTEHYLMSFLSRSYHESVKSPGAGVLKHFKIDEKGNLSELDIANTPMIFFSRPKGDYVGEGKIENILLDFYIYNATLSSDGYKVKAKVNNHQELTIDKWQPYFIKNAPEGSLVISLQLIGADGQNVSGENTSVSGAARIAGQEPLN